MLHEPAVKIEETDHAAPKKARLGVILFLIYLVIYTGFVVICLQYPESMGVHVLGTQNLAIVYGFGLIILAIIMGFIYNWACSNMEDKMNKNTGGK
ncbi:MAG: DUF485 domain-containing protein [Bacteroidota bacterium]